jgi:hypothetical protein
VTHDVGMFLFGFAVGTLTWIVIGVLVSGHDKDEDH